MISLPIRTLHLVWIARLKCGLAPVGASGTRRPRHPRPPFHAGNACPSSNPMPILFVRKLVPFSFSGPRVSRPSTIRLLFMNRGTSHEIQARALLSYAFQRIELLDEEEILLSAINRWIGCTKVSPGSAKQRRTHAGGRRERAESEMERFVGLFPLLADEWAQGSSLLMRCVPPTAYITAS